MIAYGARLAEVEQRIATIQHGLSLEEKERSAARDAAQQILPLRQELTLLQSAVADQIDRLEGAISNLRGQVTGAMRKRGGRGASPEGDASQLGEAIRNAMENAQSGDTSELDRVLEQLHKVRNGNAVSVPVAVDSDSPI